MKRLNLFLISTLMISAIATSLFLTETTNAEGMYNELHYWTVEDMLLYDSEIQAERETECGNDANCWLDFYVDHMDNTERGLERTKYQLYDRFNSERFIITGFNPSEGTIRVLYHGLDGWSKATNPNAIPKEAKELYAAWLKDPAPDPGTDMSWLSPETNHLVPYYVDDINAGDYHSGVHPAFVYHYDTDGPLPAEQVISSDTFFNDYTTNPKGSLYITSNIGGTIDYGMVNYVSCMLNPYYEEGMECNLIYTSDYAPKYVPFTSDGVPATAQTINTNPDPATQEPEPTNDPEIVADPDSTDDKLSGLEPQTDSGPTDNPEPQQAGNSIIPTTPDTGKAEEEEEKETTAIVVPWWITAIVVLGGLAIVWILMPNKRR